ncbi:MAG: hypothetical protein IAE97_12770 [Chthoniobacterales bacterium]|nr:hypothetical protein [Chthoniobacterales bacterium]
MKKLTDIARDYLDAVEVLTEARERFEEEMAEWWAYVIDDTVKPALQQISPGSFHIWENKSKPGKCHWRIRHKAPIRVEIQDPRVSGQKFYKVALQITSQPELEDHRKNQTLVAHLERAAKEHGIEDGLNWKTRELASVDIDIQPDDAEETAGRVCDAAARFFHVVLEHDRAYPKAG